MAETLVWSKRSKGVTSYEYFVDNDEKHELIEFEFMPEFINEKFSQNISDNSFMDFAYLKPFFVAENKVTPRLNLKGNIQM